jgi:hypothetical protein
MKKTRVNQPSSSDDPMLPEYDLSNKEGVRGKYYKAYQQGHATKICEEDGKITVQYFTMQDGAIILAPDVREYFPDADSVNNALRSLIALIPTKSSRQTLSSKRDRPAAPPH